MAGPTTLIVGKAKGALPKKQRGNTMDARQKHIIDKASKIRCDWDEEEAALYDKRRHEAIAKIPPVPESTAVQARVRWTLQVMKLTHTYGGDLFTSTQVRRLAEKLFPGIDGEQVPQAVYDCYRGKPLLVTYISPEIKWETVMRRLGVLGNKAVYRFETNVKKR